MNSSGKCFTGNLFGFSLTNFQKRLSSLIGFLASNHHYSSHLDLPNWSIWMPWAWEWGLRRIFIPCIDVQIIVACRPRTKLLPLSLAGPGIQHYFFSLNLHLHIFAIQCAPFSSAMFYFYFHYRCIAKSLSHSNRKFVRDSMFLEQFYIPCHRVKFKL